MLDILDRKILEILQKDNQTPQRDIGEKVGLSAAAVQRRIKRMRETKVIEKDICIIDRDMIGSNVTILVEIFLATEKIDVIDELRKIFSQSPEIQQCYYVTGESDFFLVIIVPSMKYYENLTREIFFSNQNIKRFRTMVITEVSKNSFEIPVKMLFPEHNK